MCTGDELAVTVKQNTDAAFVAETGVGAAGAVARNHRGNVVLSVCKKQQPTDSVEEANARAALFGLQELTGVQSGQVLLEMDNQRIVKEVESQYPHAVPLLWQWAPSLHARSAT